MLKEKKEEKPFPFKTCPNCGKLKSLPCDCEKNICIKCGKSVGNITFSVCDECWDKDKTQLPKEENQKSLLEQAREIAQKEMNDAVHTYYLSGLEKTIAGYEQYAKEAEEMLTMQKILNDNQKLQQRIAILEKQREEKK